MIEFVRRFHNNKVCLQYLAKKRWGTEINCPHCSQKRIYHFKDGIRYKCSQCKRIFNAKTGTIFHNTKIPMPKWFLACYLLTSHKKGISSMQLAKDIKVTQKTAWRMLHKIRSMFSDADVLRGVIEVDETFIGGLQKNKHANKRIPGTQGRSLQTKFGVLGILHRKKGHVKAIHIPNMMLKTIKPILYKYIAVGSLILTDEFDVYKKVPGYRHRWVKHSAKHYVNGNIHTNGMENFWSLVKRAILGIYHWVSGKYLQLYLDEFCFRFNTRNMSETDRVGCLLKKVAYK